MKKSKALEQGMRGIKGAEQDEALKSLETATPGKQGAPKAPKRGPLREIRVQKSGNGGFIAHPDFAPAKSSKGGLGEPYEPSQPTTHASWQEIGDHYADHWDQGQ